MASTSKDVDRGWAWVLCAGCTLAFLVIGGYLKGFGIFFSAFLEEFEANASLISLVLGVRASVYAIFAPVLTSLCDRLTERAILIVGGLLHFTCLVVSSQARSLELLIFANGAIGGLAMACTFGPIQVVIGKYFNKRKSLAMSITFCGATLGQIVMSPLIVKLFEAFGLRGTLLLYGALMLHLCVAGALARPVKMNTLQHNSNGNAHESKEENDNKKEIEMQRMTKADSYLGLNGEIISASQELFKKERPIVEEGAESGTANQKDKAAMPKPTTCQACLNVFKMFLDFSLCKSQRFMVLLVSSSLTFVPFINVMIYLFPRGREIGLSQSQSALLLTIMGACELCGRFAIGILADFKSIGPFKLYILTTFLTGVVSIIIGVVTSFVELMVLVGFLGLLGSTPIILSMPITVEILGMQRLARGLGFIAFFHGVFNTVTPPVLGLLRDVTGSYAPVFYISGGLMIVGSLVMAIDPLMKKCSKKDDTNKDSSIPLQT